MQNQFSSDLTYWESLCNASDCGKYENFLARTTPLNTAVIEMLIELK